MKTYQQMYAGVCSQLKKKYARRYRCKQAVADRVYQTCGLLDTIADDADIQNVMFLLDPANSFDADICAEVDDLTLDCREDKLGIDALTCADSLTIAQNVNGKLVLMLHFNDFWVVTR